MARKSAKRRKSECESLMAQYTSAGLEHTWDFGFLQSLLGQIEKGRVLSKKQRDRFDTMVETGIPTPKGDTATLEKIDLAINNWSNNEDRAWESDVLKSMRRYVFNGWDLSEKQKPLLKNILEKYDADLRGENIFTPTQEQLEDLKICISLYEGYAPLWREARPAVSRCVQRVRRYLSGDSPCIEKYHYEKVKKAMEPRLVKFRYPKFKKGDLASIKWNGKKSIIFCTSDVYIDNRGTIVNNWMLPDNSVQAIAQGTPGKRI